MEKTGKLKRLQGSMMFLAAVANGLEELVGRGAPGITFRAGRNAGLKYQVADKEPDLIKAFEIVRGALEDLGIHWDFELYKKQTEQHYIKEGEDGTRVKVVFTNCMVRSCQFHYGYPQKNSLCMLQHGIMCGLLQKVHGSWADYDPIHSGENACIGLVIIKERKTP